MSESDMKKFVEKFDKLEKARDNLIIYPDLRLNGSCSNMVDKDYNE